MKHSLDFVDVEVHRDLFHDVYMIVDDYSLVLLMKNSYLELSDEFIFLILVFIDECMRIGYLSHGLYFGNNPLTRLEKKIFFFS